MTSSSVDTPSAPVCGPAHTPQNAHQLLVRQRGGHQKVRLHQDPAAGNGGLQQYLAIVAAKHRLLGPEHLFASLLEWPGKAVVPGGVGEDSVGVERLRCCRLAGLLEVFRGGADHHLIGRQGLRDQVGVNQLGDPEAQVEGTLVEVHHLVAQDQLDLNLRVALHELGHQRADQRYPSVIGAVTRSRPLGASLEASTRL